MKKNVLLLLATLCASITTAFADLSTDYYLVGYINGADYGIMADSDNLGDYKFASDGTLALTFTSDTYVMVKNKDNVLYAAEMYVSTAPVVLYSTNDYPNYMEKMFVPTNVEIVFTLTEQADGTLLLDYYYLSEHIYIKHPFDGSNWEWREMAKGEDNNFTLEGYWQGTGCNINDTPSDYNAAWFPAEDIENAPAETGMLVKYTYNEVHKTLSTEISESASVILHISENWIEVGQQVAFSATTQNLSDATFVYSILAPGSSSYVALPNNWYTPETIGVYSVKVDAYAAGNNTPAASDIKEFTVVDFADLEGDYYLVGYINGVDYGCEADWENIGEYHFVNGRLNATFTEDSYVYVKTADNLNWYMTKTFDISATSAVLYNTSTGAAQKLFAPGNKNLTFRLAAYTDGSLFLTYDITTALSNTESDYRLRVHDGCVTLTADNAADIVLYTLGGQVIDIQHTANYTRRLQNGIYLMRINGATEKVIVF